MGHRAEPSAELNLEIVERSAPGSFVFLVGERTRIMK